MSLVEYYPPIATATVLFAVWVAVAYRFHKREKAGRESLTYIGWMLIVPGVLLAFFWAHGFEAPLDNGLAKLMAALTGLSMGAIGLFLVHLTFFTAAAGTKERTVRYVYFGLYSAFLVGSLLI